MAFDSINFFAKSKDHNTKTIQEESLKVSPEVELLIKTRSLIDQGWCQYSLHQHTGEDHYNYCSIGAFREASASMGAASCSKSEALLKIHNAMYPKRIIFSKYKSQVKSFDDMRVIERDIISYNDTKHRKKKDILNALDKAIDKANATS